MNVQKTAVHPSASLRNKAIWRDLGPALTSSLDLTLKETTATALDLTIPVSRAEGRTVLHVLFLGTSESSTDLEQKVKAFQSAIKSANALDLIMLINDQEDGRFQGLTALQMLLLNLGHVPTIVASAVVQILPLLQKHIEQLRKPAPVTRHPNIIPTTLIAHATSTAPSKLLSERAANILTDLFPSVKHLEEGTRTEGGQAALNDYLDTQTAREVIEFWEDEWLV